MDVAVLYKTMQIFLSLPSHLYPTSGRELIAVWIKFSITQEGHSLRPLSCSAPQKEQTTNGQEGYSAKLREPITQASHMRQTQEGEKLCSTNQPAATLYSSALVDLVAGTCYVIYIGQKQTFANCHASVHMEQPVRIVPVGPYCTDGRWCEMLMLTMMQ